MEIQEKAYRKILQINFLLVLQPNNKMYLIVNFPNKFTDTRILVLMMNQVMNH